MSQNIDEKVGWKREHAILVKEFINRHFGDWHGVNALFPYQKDHFIWKDDTIIPADARVVLKNNVEYHGLENHARQYHATAQYEFAFHYWLIAAFWRRSNMTSNGFDDDGHVHAIKFDLANAAYNRALFDWQTSNLTTQSVPQAEQFGLSMEKIQKMEDCALSQLDGVYSDKTVKE